MVGVSAKTRKEMYLDEIEGSLKFFREAPDTDLCADHIEKLSNHILCALDVYEEKQKQYDTEV